MFAGNASLSKNAKGLGTLGDKLLKIMEGNLKKTLKKGLQSEEYRLAYQSNLDLLSVNLVKNMKTTKTLEMLCQAIFKKNYTLYLKHEEMLDQNKQERM